MTLRPTSPAGVPRWACHRPGCDWTPAEPEAVFGPARTQLLEHADHTGHPLCQLCRHSLDGSEHHTCERCLTRTRRTVQRIADLYALLPAQIELGQFRGRGADLAGGRGHHSDTTIPGGTALVLLVTGTHGGVPRELTDSERAAAREPVRWWLREAVGPLTRTEYLRLERTAQGLEHAADERRDDSVSVVGSLLSWANDWREQRDELPLPPDARLTTVTGYLETHMRWAATGRDRHLERLVGRPAEAFTDFAQELRDLLTKLEDTHGLLNRPQRNDTSCLQCGSKLVRPYRPADPCDHRPPEFPPAEVPIVPLGLTYLVPIAERRRIYERRLENYELAHKACDQGGVGEDEWTCPSCDTTYRPENYMIARRQMLEDTRRDKQASRG